MQSNQIICALSILLTQAALSATTQQTDAVQSVLRTTRPITLDGRLDETEWSQVQPIDRFFETYPGERTPAPERTEARLLYDEDYLYIGFRLWLKHPERLRTPFVRRDKVNSTHDYVQIYLDPQGSRRGSYLFRVNARGTKTDGYQNEAQESETLDPDYDWDVASHIDDRGWSSELRIPLSTLRIARTGIQRWAVIVTRGVPRDQNTQMASAPFPHDSNCFLCYAGQIEFPDLVPKADHFIATPDITVTRSLNSGTPGAGDDTGIEPGLDAKWLPYSGAALDLTVNPDFSQVEADLAQLSANQRFALDFPEKRPFFREGADLVSTAIPAVYTRSVAAPDYGVRFTHRSRGIEGTAFVARDGGKPAIIEPGFLGSVQVLPDFDSSDGFARLRQSLGHGDVGGLVAAKRNEDGSRNTVGGLDATWATGDDRVLGQVLGSLTDNPDRPDLFADWRGQSLNGSAALLQWDHSTSNVWSLRYERYSPQFRSWLGYVPRVGYELVHGEYYRPFYSTAKWLNTIEPYVSMDRVQGIDYNQGHESDPVLGLVLAGYKNFSADISWHPDAVVLDRAGRERKTHYVAWQLSATPGTRLPFVAFTGQVGESVDNATGEVVSSNTTGLRIMARPRDRLELEARYDRNVLNGLADEPRRLTEAATQLFATWHFSARFYALLTWQRYVTSCCFSADNRYHRTSASLQFNADWSRDVHMYWGVRTGSERFGVDSQPGRGTEIYLKMAYTLRR